MCCVVLLEYTAIGYLGFRTHLGKRLALCKGVRNTGRVQECGSLHGDSVPADALSLQESLMKFLVISYLSKLSMRGK